MIIRKEDVEENVKGGFLQRHYIDSATGAGSISLSTVTLQPGTSLAPRYHLVEDAIQGDTPFTVVYAWPSVHVERFGV